MLETLTTERTARSLLALLDLAKALGSEIDLDALLRVIVENASSVVEAERTSIFIYDEARDVLWTRLAQGLDAVRIELSHGEGVAGDVAHTRKLANIIDAYSDSRFTNEYDRRTGYHTTSIIAAPVISTSGQLLGVLQSVNKVTADRFDAHDETLMTAIASHVAVAIERASLTASQIENERISEALNVARDIQMQMLPHGIEQDERFDLHAYMRPATMVGGDLYDFILERNRLYFCIGDVSGKGIGSALVMALAKTHLRANVPHAKDAAQLAAIVNTRLCEETGPTIFVTSLCAFLDLATGSLRFANAGHDRPFLLHADGTVDLIETKPGIALGVLPNFDYQMQQIKLQPGDALFLYSDGVTEAVNQADELFSMERLREVLFIYGDRGAKEIIEAVADAIDHFAEGAPQADDITMLCVRYQP